VFSSHLSNNSLTIVKLAKKLLYVPYLEGGKTPMGMDAPGMVQILFKLLKLKLPRFVHQQVYFGELIHFIENGAAGDLIFFENKKGIIDHVGIYLGEGKIIHVADRVKIDLVDHFGIFDEAKKAYTYKLRVIKRLLL
jgi:cell wall-associated NlpC family hydrolase